MSRKPEEYEFNADQQGQIAALELQPDAAGCFTAKSFLRICDLGIIGKTERTELWDGRIRRKPPHRRKAQNMVSRIARYLNRKARLENEVAVYSLLRLDERNILLPDIAVLDEAASEDRINYPAAAGILLAVEISEQEPDEEQELRIGKYAAAGIPELWIPVLASVELQIYRYPEAGRHREVRYAYSEAPVRPPGLPFVDTTPAQLFGVGQSKQKAREPGG